jgi:hypothetical protein
MVIAVMSIPIIIGFTMRAPSEADDLHYDQACNTKDPAECAKIDPNGSADPINAYAVGLLSQPRRDATRPQPCDHVKSASLDRLIGSVVAKSKCRNQRYTIATAFPGA